MAMSGRRGQELYRMLVEPAGPIAVGSRVVVVPDGALHTINFETLVVPGPPPRYWIENAVISNAGSLQLIAAQHGVTPAASSMLLVGDPPSPEASFPPLLHANREVDLIAQRFSGARILRGQQANPSAYQEAKPGAFDYIHFVAHGVGTRQTPFDSAVILGKDQNNQYRLSARDIVDIPLRARLVTISSCHGAGSRTYAGEGLVGLAWAFLSAGADEVIAALWQVQDQTTPDLMQHMYAGILSGHEPAVALRDAKLELVHSGSIRSKPSYWAPFVLYTGR
jgi:CHAT domain-containing protein